MLGSLFKSGSSQKTSTNTQGGSTGSFNNQTNANAQQQTGGSNQQRAYFGDQAQPVLGQLGNYFAGGPSQGQQAAQGFFMNQLTQDPSQLNQYSQNFINASRANTDRSMADAFGRAKSVGQNIGQNAAGTAMMREQGNLANQQNMMENQFAAQQMNQQIANQFAAANGLNAQEAQQLASMINFANMFKGSDQNFQQQGTSSQAQNATGTQNQNYWQNSNQNTEGSGSNSPASIFGSALSGFSNMGGLSGISDLFSFGG